MRLTTKSKYLLQSMALLSSIAALAHAETPSANVFFYSGNPAEDADAYPYVGADVPGYLTGIIAPFDGVSITFSRDSTDPLTGFTPETNTTLNQNADPSSFVIFNQKTPTKSVAYFGDKGVYDVTRTLAQPYAGDYITPQRITFLTPDAVTSIMYSIDNQPLQLWDGDPISIVETTTLTYQGMNPEDTGPIKTVLYTINNLNCNDVDGDDIPDRIESLVGTDPFLSEGDANKNQFNDFEELMRGATSIVPSILPEVDDTDQDSWIDYDEMLRGTLINDDTSVPAAPSLETVEIALSGIVSNLANGVVPPISPSPGKSEPDNYQIEVLTPSGSPIGGFQEAEEFFSLHTSGEQFHLIRARALDGSGRQLLSVVPPKGLCIDSDLFCADSDSLSDWRSGYLAQYEANILQQINNQLVNPRSTAEALLLNRYYEIASGEAYIPGTENMGPSQELVFSLRAGRNEAELYAAIQAGVTNEMVTLVTDYFHYATSPNEHSMMEQLRQAFSGMAPAPGTIPVGVRTGNIPLVATQTANFFQSLAEGETVLTGNIQIHPSGFELDVNGTIYRLSGLADTFAPGSEITLRAIVDVDDCNFTSPLARVTELISRVPAPAPPSQDSDMDNLDDDWELFNFGDLDQDGFGDADNDGISNEDEESGNTNPNVSDAPVFASFQGDADLSTVVNAVDLVHVQLNLGSDYSCNQCRGIGDADGSQIVEQNDFDSVGNNLFAEYPEAPCSIILDACNKSNETVVIDLTDADEKGVSMPTMFLENIPAGIEINDTFTVTLKINTDGSLVRAASTRLNYNSDVLEVLLVTPNTTTFDAYSVVNFGEDTIDLALLSHSDQSGELELATIEFKAIAEGLSAIDLATDETITGIVQSDGQALDNLQTLTRGIAVGGAVSDQWIMF